MLYVINFNILSIVFLDWINNIQFELVFFFENCKRNIVKYAYQGGYLRSIRVFVWAVGHTLSVMCDINCKICQVITTQWLLSLQPAKERLHITSSENYNFDPPPSPPCNNLSSLLNPPFDYVNIVLTPLPHPFYNFNIFNNILISLK